LVGLIVFLQGTTSQIIYSGMIGEVFAALLKMAGIHSMDRTKCILLVATVALWPMCLLRDLSSLAFTSVLGFSAVMYTVTFMVVRAIDGSYSIANGGKFVSTAADISLLAAAPSFDKSSLWNMDFGSLILMSNLGLAYIAHYNAPAYWRELKGGSIPTFNKMVRTSYAILASIYLLAMCAGYYTFGDVCLGNILMNYHPGDILSTFGRVATGCSIVFGFPLVHNGAREGLKSFTNRAFGWTCLTNPDNHAVLATCYLAIVTVIATLVKDVRVVVGLAGAAFGSFLVYICPVMIYINVVRNVKGVDSQEYKIAKRNNLALIPFGIFCGSMGVTMTIKETLKRAAETAAAAASITAATN
jgi:amino acid permease